MPKRATIDSSSICNTTMSREDRKIEQTIRIIERAEKQRLKREQKRKLAVVNKVSGTSSGSGSGKPPGVGPTAPAQRKHKHIQQTKPEPRVINTNVKIHIMFSDRVHAQNASSRYFFERKRNIEQRQRQEQEEFWAKVAHSHNLIQSQFAQMSNAFQNNQAALLGAQSNPLMFPSPNMTPNPQQLGGFNQAMAKYANPGETGGNYEAVEDYTGSSYCSSASKLMQQKPQLSDEEQITRFNPQQLAASGPHSHLINSKSLMLPSTSQTPNHNCQQFNNLWSDERRQQKLNPITEESPLKNPISEDNSSVQGAEPKSASGVPPVTLSINLKKAAHTSPAEDSQVVEQNEAQRILELTRQQMSNQTSSNRN